MAYRIIFIAYELSWHVILSVQILPCPGLGHALWYGGFRRIYRFSLRLDVFRFIRPEPFGAIVMGTTDYGSVQDVFVAMFSNSTVLMMLVGILAFAAIEQTGAGDWLIAKLLNSKIAKKSPIFIVEIFLFIFYLGNIIGLCWFLYFAMLPLCAEMLLKCGYEKGRQI